MISKITTFLLLFFIFSFLFKTGSAFDQDLGRHIKLGEIIIKSGSVPATNLFSYTNPDFPFINTHWLFEAFAHLFVQTLGIGTFSIFKIALILFTCFLTLKLIPGRNILFLPIAFIFAHVLRERTELRPEIFSFFFTACTYYILETSLQKNRYKLVYILPFVQFIWINTHIYFFVGLVLQSIFLIQLIYNNLRFHLGGGKPASPAGGLKALSIIFAFSVLLSLINPNGIKGLVYPLTVNQNYGYQIVENQTIFFLENIGFSDPNFIFAKICWLIVAVGLFAGLLRKKLNIADLLVCLFGLGLSFLNVRGIPYLFFLCLPVTLKTLNFSKNHPFFRAASFLVIILLLIKSLFYLSGEYYKNNNELPQTGFSEVEGIKRGMDFVLKNNLPGPIFNNFDIGSYIIYRGYPSYRVFVDGRPEAYPSSFFTDIYVPIQYDYTKFKQAEIKYNFKTVIFSINDQTPWGQNFLKNIVKDPDWKLVFIDDFVVISIKKDAGLDLTEIDLNQLKPGSYNFSNHRSYLSMAIFLRNTDNSDAAALFIAHSNAFRDFRKK